MVNIAVVCFFFSSRRRHTRLQGDWSSDVCSYDLAARPPSDVPRLPRCAISPSRAPSSARSLSLDHPVRPIRPPNRVESRSDAERPSRSEEHTSELQSPCNLVCRLLLEKKKNKYTNPT